ncbi:2-dehydropantoate 2-reductase [Clostridium sp. AM58-1XD]|uniref:ketopantoate reductase family protein n=1 Tax=Clostridium sp. AM58-1XD TaxID=2292307 RepID=UPI000E4FC230|nr:2-dehydropantoate 2-reductase [Clostridium sp. AM58-1XD]RGZ01194.1 2-dehydropantoate 2-reductase [Clostridium sp. AM58-1XD]
MKIVIIGAGAMGSLFGGTLASVADVCLYDVNQTHVDAINRNGLLMSRGAEKNYVKVRATTKPEEIGEADAVIFFTKYTFMEQAAKDALCCIGPKTVAVTLQNGLGCMDIMKKYLREEQIYYGLTAYTSDMKGPGHIELTTNENVGTYFWALNGSVSPEAKQLETVMREAGFHVEITREVDERIWKKLMVNCSENTLCGILRMRVGQLIHTPESYEILKQVVGEVCSVARAKGIEISDEAGLAYVMEISRAVEGHLPSMALDIQKGRKTEIACLNEAVIAEGRRLGVATPALEMTAQMVRAIEKNYSVLAF